MTDKMLVLLVDDDDDFITGFKSGVADFIEDARFLYASNRAEAVTLLREHSGNLALAILDQNLSSREDRTGVYYLDEEKAEGLSLISYISGNISRKTKIIMLTAYARTDDRSEVAKKLGAHGYILKGKDRDVIKVIKEQLKAYKESAGEKE